jgi:hypothetical protein
MKKVIMVAMMVLVMIAGSVIPVSAENDDLAANDQDTLIRPTLAIKVPASVSVGEKVQLYVFDRHSGEPVARAGVWAVNANNTAVITSASSDVAMEGTGKFLGWTGTDGGLTTVFREPGLVLLVAVRDRYNPGFAWISVRQANQLVVKAPTSAMVGEPVTITVFDRMTGVPVGGASVWAFIVNNQAPNTENTEDLISYATAYGIPFGETNNQGQVTGKFVKAGSYVILAIKNSYSPGISKITILGEKALAIRAPETVKVREPFPLQVVEKTVLTVVIPVPKASVWAVAVDNVQALDAAVDLPALAERYGIYLGITNERGYIEPQPRLFRPGKYWLIAVMPGYVPGVSPITVIPIPTITPERLQKSESKVIMDKNATTVMEAITSVRKPNVILRIKDIITGLAVLDESDQ